MDRTSNDIQCPTKMREFTLRQSEQRQCGQSEDWILEYHWLHALAKSINVVLVCKFWLSLVKISKEPSRLQEVSPLWQCWTVMRRTVRARSFFTTLIHCGTRQVHRPTTTHSTRPSGPHWGWGTGRSSPEIQVRIAYIVYDHIDAYWCLNLHVR